MGKPTEGEELVYDGEPDYPHSQANEAGAQDDLEDSDA
jgi:hypothetical protein